MLYGFNLFILLLYLLCGILVFTIHEASKAFISAKLGDPLPKRDGRLTLNPLKHIEPIGLIIMTVWGFGWGNPVETASIYYKDRKKGTLLTYTIPSLINLFIGMLIGFFLGIIKDNTLYTILYTFAVLNIRNALFNIIPVYPLDGAKVFAVLRSPDKAIRMANNEKIYQMLLIMLILWGIVPAVIDPVCKILLSFGF
ncbi:site-2 protease family protein [Anaeropeptidivorans aminofermentans]|jgi:Zn-dependent protease|uniref:site-2 protease family protein n=1 Tax=Anaeropeptidivorans aminofermentans TaxID=2934315 RepID=UPI002024F973|nr:site-2 protease family protein [Anaeropeptidivorans aminofermentans]MBE6012519.1 site-2 protease family protein [Lachnospiraceae bacterium]